MSLHVAFEASSPSLVLGPTLDALPSLEVALERQYALDPARPIAFCWTRCRNRKRLERALAADPTVARFDRIASGDDRDRYRLQRSETNVVGAYRQWVAAGGELLECRGADGRWNVEMRFPDRTSFGRYHDFLVDEGVSVELRRLAETDARSRRAGDPTLTDRQREALALAHERGFFEVPRETDLAEIAAQLEISNQAVSERLRRGQARLVESHVVD
ncbi:Bacterio-opsin activator HTH domain protein [Natrinema pellirubrum DSM 15624]|uniref:Bacterio-opsin activator HTH domain protein n=1 Tax=Natrinema pellirubrum (strain DSM 15624 / CIP 106293 / JCM 10476 / NCIMB 786 / 157) TaxID=797303 RepID=L0JKI7_NATP1|nr:helix-turn-helix domain-containing protein [Natrinema pellirubrum]AGB30861.1 putative DNA binding protein [Natrinema pellirubrum DSM 15624]ELY80752.1 Bacterio-opsin activator HTH domain protein [Natrinema pellirubrum DSM 15624]